MSTTVEFSGVDPEKAVEHGKLYFAEAHGGFKPSMNHQPLIEKLVASMPPPPDGSKWEINPQDGPGISFYVAGKRLKATEDISALKQVDAIRIPLRLVRVTEE